jgi:hypothetical protein
MCVCVCVYIKGARRRDGGGIRGRCARHRGRCARHSGWAARCALRAGRRNAGLLHWQAATVVPSAAGDLRLLRKVPLPEPLHTSSHTSSWARAQRGWLAGAGTRGRLRTGVGMGLFRGGDVETAWVSACSIFVLQRRR